MIFTHRAVRRSLSLAAILLASMVGAVGLSSLPQGSSTASAETLSDGTVAFVAQPRLVAASATRTGAFELNSTYYLTVNLPADASVGLQSLTVRLSQGDAPWLRFNLAETTAFEGTQDSRGANLPIGQVTQDPDTQAITVRFDPAVSPGRAITLALHPDRNPRDGGIYLFEVTANPVGEQVRSAFVGYARLQFYENDRDNGPFL